MIEKWLVLSILSLEYFEKDKYLLIFMSLWLYIKWEYKDFYFERDFWNVGR